MNHKKNSTNDHAGNRIIVVNTGYSKKKFILQRIKQLGYFLIVVNKDKNWAQPYVDEWIIADTFDHDGTIEAVRKYLHKNQVDGIVTFWEDDVLLTSKIVDQLGFIGIPFHIALKARNKYLFRQFCQENNLPYPKYKFIQRSQDLELVKNDFSFPVIVKPVLGSSSAFVIKANHQDELRSIYDYVVKNISPNIEASLHDGINILIEEYIDGDEVDIDLILQNGKVKFWSISDNFATKEPFFMETGQATPSTLPVNKQRQLIDMAEEMLEKMGIFDGCIHFEAKIGKNGAIPIEINLRLGGDEIYSFVKTAWNYDLIENALKIATGEYIPPYIKPDVPFRYLVSHSIVPSRSGIMSNLDIPKKFPDEYRVKDCVFYKKVGDVIIAPPANYEFIGLLTAEGDTPVDAQQNLDDALKLIEFDITYFSQTSSLGKTKRRTQNKPAFLASSASEVSGKAKIEKIRHIDLRNQRKLHVGIGCNFFSSEDGAIEADLTSVGSKIKETLSELGYNTTFIDFNQINSAQKILESGNIDIVFNVCERINNSSLLEPHAASLLDIYQIPYTGSSPFTLSLCIDKIRVKKLLTYHNIPTAKWDYLYNLDDEVRDDLTYPLIVKPANSDNSIGVTQESVVINKKQLYEQLEYVINHLQRPAIIEEYLEGDEYDVSILGSEVDDFQVLPLSRNIYHMPVGKWNIWTMEDKFGLSDLARNHSEVQKPPRKVSQKLLSLITEIALDTYNILDCHDYGRVDVKLDKDGNPHVLELNPNPSINYGDCVPTVAQIVGMDYGQFLEKIISLAIGRYKNNPPYYHLQSTLM